MPDALEISPRFSRWLLAGACLVLALGSIRFLLGGAPAAADSSSHYSEILGVAELLAAGETDFWFGRTNLGYPLFLAYHPLPGLVFGALFALLGELISPMLVFKLAMVGPWILMPIAWAKGARWLGLDRLTAVWLGILSVTVSDWHDFGLSLRSVAYTGLFTQGLGMLLLPLCVGSSWRYLVRGEGGLRAPALLLTTTILTHMFFGLYAAIAAALMAVFAPREALVRTRRLVLMSTAAFLLIAFWIIPFLANAEYQGGIPWRGPRHDGFPLSELLGRLAAGDFFDAGRPPVLTLLTAAGALIALLRKDQILRWVLALFILSFLLLMGPTNLGPLYYRIPLHRDMEVVRYLSGVHFAALLLAAAALSRGIALAPAAIARISRGAIRAHVLGPLLVIAIAAPVLAGRWWTYDQELITFDVDDDSYSQLVHHLSSSPDRGRFLSTLALKSDSHVFRDLLSSLSGRPQAHSNARGYHDTLSLYYADGIRLNTASLRLFNVSRLVVAGEVPIPETAALPVIETEIARIYATQISPGYFDFVRTPFTIEGDLRAVRPILRSYSAGFFPTGVLPRLSRSPSWTGGVALRTRDAVRPLADDAAQDFTLFLDMTAEALPRPIRSRVVEESNGPNEYAAKVEVADAEERLMVKVSFHPYWKAEIDGRPAPIDLVAPNFMAIDVPPGEHAVRFLYRNPLYQKLLFCASILAVLAWTAFDVRRRRRTEYRAA